MLYNKKLILPGDPDPETYNPYQKIQLPDGTYYMPSRKPMKKYDIPKQKDESFKEPSNKNSMTPKEIYRKISDSVYGVEDYKKEISVYLWKCMNGRRPKGALLISGQTGCGKTEVIRSIRQWYHPMVVIDGSTLTPEGYKGNNKVSTGLHVLLTESRKYNCSKNTPLFIIDEVDKMLNKGMASSAKDYALELQSELLKVIEGTQINIQPYKDGPELMFDTETVAFVLMGSFSRISRDKSEEHHIGFNTEKAVRKTFRSVSEEDILGSLTPEMQGRIGQTIVVDDLTEDDFRAILKSEKYSPMKRIGEEYGVRITASNVAIADMARRAFESGLGVRSLNNIISRELDHRLFDDPDIQSIYIGGTDSRWKSESEEEVI